MSLLLVDAVTLSYTKRERSRDWQGCSLYCGGHIQERTENFGPRGGASLIWGITKRITTSFLVRRTKQIQKRPQLMYTKNGQYDELLLLKRILTNFS